MSCGPTYGQFIAWLHAAGLLPPAGGGLTVTSGTGNVAGAAITTGKLVYVAGWDNVNSCPMVALATPADLLTCATYITSGTVPAGLVASSTGTVAKQGTITGLALVAAIGDPAYLASAGAGNVQAGTTGLTTSNICQQIVGYFVTAGTSVYADLSAAPVHVLGTSELQDAAVTAAKADLTANWTWTGTSPQVTLGNSSTNGGLRIYESGNHYVTIGLASLTGNATYTLPDAGGSATFILSQGTTALAITSAGPQITLGDGVGKAGQLRLTDGTAASRTADILQASLAANRTYTVPDAGADATFILSQGTTAMTNTAASPQVTLGSASVVSGLALRDGSSANAGTITATTLTGARTYTFPNATGSVPVSNKAMVALPQASYTNTSPANVRFGDVQMVKSTSQISATVTGVPDSTSSNGSVVFVQFHGIVGSGGAAVWPGAFVVKAEVLTGTLTISLLNASTGAALALGATTAANFSYLILY